MDDRLSRLEENQGKEEKEASNLGDASSNAQLSTVPPTPEDRGVIVNLHTFI